MYGLLAICVQLSPQRIEENVHLVLREKYGDRMKPQKGTDEKFYEELFAHAAPRFITVGQIGGENGDPVKLQANLFLNEIKAQAALPVIKSYLKLYTTISLEKLAGFLEMDPIDLRSYLMCLKHKTREEIQDLDFIITDQGMIQIFTTKHTQKTFEKFFIRQNKKFDSIANF